MTNPTFTTKDLERLVKSLKKHAIKPFTVKTQKEADYHNETDKLFSEVLGHPFGGNWKVGMEYYKMDHHRGLFGVPSE